MVAESLRRHYGAAPDVGPRYTWRTLATVVLDGARAIQVRNQARKRLEWPGEEAGDIALLSVESLAEQLRDAGHSAKHASVLIALAHWWCREPMRVAEQAAAWEKPIDLLRGELRQIRGVSLTLADRILLFVGGLPVFPVDRAAMRIFCRHGWLDPTAEYDEWQSFACSPGNVCSPGFSWSPNPTPTLPPPSPLAELSHHLTRLGRDHCGPTAKCTGCPLEPLLPTGGPVLLGEDEGLSC